MNAGQPLRTSSNLFVAGSNPDLGLANFFVETD